MKRNLSLIFVLCLFCSTLLAACAPASGSGSGSGSAAGGAPTTEPITVKVDCSNTSGGPWDVGLRKFMELVNEKIPGRVNFEYYPDGQLTNSDMRVSIEMVQTGSVHMSAILPSIYEQFDQRWQIYSLPYLFSGLEEARASCDGESGQYMLSLLPEKGMEGLAIWEHGFRHLTTANKEVHLPGDVAGLKIRVMDSPTFISMFNHLNALPTVTSMGELFTALQQGAVDGQENPLTSIARRKFNEVQDYLMMTYHSYAPVVLVVNKAFWDTLPEDVQAAFRAAAVESTQYERDAAEQEEITWKEELTKDMTVIDLTDEEIAQWQTAMEPVYSEFEATIGEDIYQLFNIN